MDVSSKINEAANLIRSLDGENPNAEHELYKLFEQSIISGNVKVIEYLLQNLNLEDYSLIKFAAKNSQDSHVFKLLFEYHINKKISKPVSLCDFMPIFKSLLNLYKHLYKISKGRKNNGVVDCLEKDCIRYLISQIINNVSGYEKYVYEILSNIKYDKYILNEILYDLSYKLIEDLNWSDPNSHYKNIGIFRPVYYLVRDFIELGASYSGSTLLIGVQILNPDLVKSSLHYAPDGYITEGDINYAMELLSQRDARYNYDYRRIFELLIKHNANNKETILKALKKVHESDVRLLFSKGIINLDDFTKLVGNL